MFDKTHPAAGGEITLSCLLFSRNGAPRLILKLLYDLETILENIAKFLVTVVPSCSAARCSEPPYLNPGTRPVPKHLTIFSKISLSFEDRCWDLLIEVTREPKTFSLRRCAIGGGLDTDQAQPEGRGIGRRGQW